MSLERASSCFGLSVTEGFILDSLPALRARSIYLFSLSISFQRWSIRAFCMRFLFPRIISWPGSCSIFSCSVYGRYLFPSHNNEPPRKWDPVYSPRSSLKKSGNLFGKPRSFRKKAEVSAYSRSCFFITPPATTKFQESRMAADQKV